MSPSIFVSMASYRDTEGPATLADLFARADAPERVFAGVFWQVAPGIDDDCSSIPVTVPRTQVRELRIDPAQSLGACWARHCIQTELFAGEDYYLQIDSHMRFVPGWDTLLVAMAGRCASARPVLSTYPAAYTPGGRLDPPLVTVLVGKGFSNLGVLLQHSRNLDIHCLPSRPPPSAFCAAGFLFGPGNLVRDVPYDPHIYFHGEEITLATRLWTHGYDLFSPDRHVVWHDYSADRGRPRHWHDARDWGAINTRAIARVRHLLGAATCSDPQALLEIDRYGLGTARSLGEYERHADLSFARGELGPRARDGRFPAHPPCDAPSRARRQRFAAIYRDNGWGAASTRSGSGATESSTALLRPLLRNLVAELDIRVLVDAGCGEFGWMRDVAEAVDLYLGYDIVPELCERNLAMVAGEPRRLFACADITAAVLPRADAILCRHCLTHLPDADVQQALARFRESGSRYLLATTYDQPDSRLTSACGWRKLDLAHPRFGLGRPLRHLVDLRGAGGCRLTLWRLEGAARALPSALEAVEEAGE